MLHQKPAEITEVITSALSQFVPVFLCKHLLEEAISAILMLSFLMMPFISSDLFRENPKLSLFGEMVGVDIRGLLHA